MAETGIPERLAARVIVLDPDDRLLLFRYDDPPPNGRHWNTPGGGLEPGEGFQAGAQRELIEETGWYDVRVLPEVVHRRTVIMEHGGRIVRQREQYFTARVLIARRPLGDVGSMHVTDGIDGSGWWSVAELETTEQAIWPDGLAELVRRLTSRGGSAARDAGYPAAGEAITGYQPAAAPTCAWKS